MRRVVTALALVVAAGALAACSSSPTSTTTGANSGTAVPVVSVPAAASGSQAGTNTDILSPTAVVTPGEMFPSDPASVPQAVLDNLTAKKPMLVYFYDPSTSVAADQRKEIDAAIKKYSGSIKLVTFDYTVALGSTTASSTLPAEVNKAVLMTGQLKVNTTPYIVFVDRYGRITYRFAGFTDRGLLTREVLRATE